MSKVRLGGVVEPAGAYYPGLPSYAVFGPAANTGVGEIILISPLVSADIGLRRASSCVVTSYRFLQTDVIMTGVR